MCMHPLCVVGVLDLLPGNLGNVEVTFPQLDLQRLRLIDLKASISWGDSPILNIRRQWQRV